MSERLPYLKIQCSWSGDLSNLFHGFFVTGSKNFKDVGLAFSRGFEQVDIFIEGRVRERGERAPGWFWLHTSGPNMLEERGDGQALRRG